MRIPVVHGIIRRRMLVNFRVDPATLRQLLPGPFRPKLHDGWAIAGICLIRLEQIRPAMVPAALGVASENAAHRIAVAWDDPDGTEREGVFIPRRDTGSHLSHMAGGRIFPGEHHLATFDVADDGDRIAFRMNARDGRVSVRLRAHAAEGLPASSCFRSLAESSRFFEGGSLGYSVTSDPARLDGLLLRTREWSVGALEVEDVESSIFSNRMIFPSGSAVFDHALIMRDVAHEWHQAADMRVTSPAPMPAAMNLAPAA
jgi:hypothetical protein